MSAVCIAPSAQKHPVKKVQLSPRTTAEKKSIKQKKPNFIQRFLLKMVLKKMQKKAQSPNQKRKIHWAALTGFICGILGLLIPLIPSILAIIFSAMAMSKTGKEKEYSGQGYAIAGLVLGILMTILVGAFLLLVALVTVA
jgi:uncharacterized membrane protein